MKRPNRRRKSHTRRRTLILAVVTLAIWLAAFSWIYESMTASSAAAQRDFLAQALDHAITTCYALEGMYPPDLDYMKEHYGLVYNEDLFYVDYQPIAANIRPAYYIIEVSS